MISLLNLTVEKIIALDNITPKKIVKHLIVFIYFGSLNLFQARIFSILFSYSFFYLKTFIIKRSSPKTHTSLKKICENKLPNNPLNISIGYPKHKDDLGRNYF